MSATPVTPIAGLGSVITTGGTSVLVANAGPNGGFIMNPLSVADQFASPGGHTAETLYVDPVGTCPSASIGQTRFGIPPGGTWSLIPGQTTQTFVNAAQSGHRFSVVTW